MNVLVVFPVALATAVAARLGVLAVMAVRVDERKSIVLSGAIAASIFTSFYAEGSDHEDKER